MHTQLENDEDMFKYITDPETGETIDLNTELGNLILKNYIESLTNGPDSKNIISTKSFYQQEKSENENIEKTTKKLSCHQYEIEDIIENKLCSKPKESWKPTKNKIVWTRRSSGLWQLGVIGDVGENRIDVYFNDNNKKIGVKKGLKYKDVLPTTGSIKDLLR